MEGRDAEAPPERGFALHQSGALRYLARLMRNLGVKVTRIATGTPTGSDLE